MSLESLNKAIALFLTGAFVFTMLVVLLWSSMIQMAPELDGFKNLDGSILTAMALAVSGVLGMAVDGIAEISVRKIIYLKSRSSWFLRLTGQVPYYEPPGRRCQPLGWRSPRGESNL